jgi:hypothetical protein
MNTVPSGPTGSTGHLRAYRYQQPKCRRQTHRWSPSASYEVCSPIRSAGEHMGPPIHRRRLRLLEVSASLAAYGELRITCGR